MVDPPETRKGNARKTASKQEGRYLVANAMARRAIDTQRGNDSEWVFPRGPRKEEKMPSRTGRINNSGWRTARALAGLPVRVHDLRHTFGERLEAVGVPWEYRKILLGHTVQDVTAHYSAPGLARLLAEAEKVTRERAKVIRIGAQLAPHRREAKEKKSVTA